VILRGESLQSHGVAGWAYVVPDALLQAAPAIQQVTSTWFCQLHGQQAKSLQESCTLHRGVRSAAKHLLCPSCVCAVLLYLPGSAPQVSISTDPYAVFTDADWALMIGAKPRGPGQERADLLDQNGRIFVEQVGA
jgi:hypothetical protein